MKPQYFAIALLAALPVQAGAHYPGSKVQGQDIRVSHADLDLRTSAGVKTLDRRLARAVQAVCPGARGTGEIVQKIAARRCVARKNAEIAPQRSRAVAAHRNAGLLAGRLR